MDGYSGYGYPPGSNPDYSGPNQRSGQTTAPSPHPGWFAISFVEIKLSSFLPLMTIHCANLKSLHSFGFEIFEINSV